MTGSQGGHRLSIVIPVYNGAGTVGSLVETLLEVLASENLEIVLVNDSSPDDSDRVCRDLHARFPESISYFRLSRNFGEHNAVMAGLNHTSGDHVVILDDDFQNPPEEVLRLVDEARQGDYDVVYSRYDTKRHSLFRNLGSGLHNWLASHLLDKPKSLYLSSFKCLNRFAVDEITGYSGPFPYIDGLVLRATRNIGVLTVRHDARRQGRSGYTLRKLIRLWLNMLLNFSVMPLRLSSLVGLVMVFLGMALAIAVILEKFLHPETPLGWSSLIVTVVTFSGMQLVVLGLVGEYVGHLFLAANRTPQFVIREAHPRTGAAD